MRQKLVISQSLIKDVIVNGNEIDVCPLLLWNTSISKDLRAAPTRPMLNGSYFEYLALGSGAEGTEAVTELPLLKGGKKSADQVRIEAQATVFMNVLDQYGANIENTQIVFEREWDHEDNIWDEDFEIIIRGVTDFRSPITGVGINGHGERAIITIPNAIHDLKLTADVNNTFGDYTWGTPYAMDHIQAKIYNYLTELPFFYWVFDYKTKPEYKIIHKYVDVVARMEMHETIRKVAEKLIGFEKYEWEPVPCYSLCKNCVVAEHGLCDKQILKQDIIVI